MVKISVEGVSRVFGPEPGAAMALLDRGVCKEKILRETGNIIGVNKVDLKIRSGEIFVIMGLSGSGKSTLIRHFNRLIEPTAGKILIDGQDILQLDEAGLRDLRRYKISMVFQKFGLLPHKSVLQNVASGLLISGVAKKEALARAEAQIEIVGLAGFEDKLPFQLSGGMQQRVGLARALATDAEILLMDEAFSALDPLIRYDMQRQLLELQRKLQKTIVFITHDLDEALRIGNHIAILKNGALSQVGTLEEILLNPADDYVKRFVMDVNRSYVVTAGSIAVEAASVPESDFTAEKIAQHFASATEQPLIAVAANGAPVKIATGTQDKQIHAAVTVDTDTTLENIFKAASQSRAPLCVVNADAELEGCVTAEKIFNAISRP